MNTSVNNLLARFTAPLLLLFLALVTFPGTTEAAEKTVFDATGQFYFALFTSSSGSIERIVTITASENLTLIDKQSQKQSLVTVTIEQTDTSTPIPTEMQFFGTSEDGVFQKSGNLRSGTVQDVVTVSDTAGGSFDVTLNVSWNGVGAITRQSSRLHFHDFDSVSVANLTGNTRSAEAFGSVTDGTTNFTPAPADPSVSFMTSIVSGSMTIFKTK